MGGEGLRNAVSVFYSPSKLGFASIEGFSYIKSSKERLITAVNCSSSNISTDKQQKLRSINEKKTTVWIFQAKKLVRLNMRTH